MCIGVFVRTSVARGQTCDSAQLDLKWMLSGTAGKGPERLRVEEKLQNRIRPACRGPSSARLCQLPKLSFLDQHLPHSHERGLRQPWAGTLRPSPSWQEKLPHTLAQPSVTLKAVFSVCLTPVTGHCSRSPQCDVCFLHVPCLLWSFFFL